MSLISVFRFIKKKKKERIARNQANIAMFERTAGEQAGRSVLELSYSGYWEAMKHPSRICPPSCPPPPLEFAQALLGRRFPIYSFRR